MYRGDDYVRPEAAAVLSDPPALLFDAPFGTGDFEIVLRLTILLVLGRIEEREMLADDLVRPVALDALRAVVPAGHIAVRIEHEDGVILHAVDEQAEHLLALAQALFVFAMPRHVAGDLREADERSGVVAQRGDDRVRPEARAFFSDAPSFVFDASFLGGFAQFPLRLLVFQILGAVEEREVLPDDLIGVVAHDAFRPGVPGANIPRWAEHE